MNRLARRAILLLVAAMILPTAVTVLAPLLTNSLRSHLTAHPGIVADLMSAFLGVLFCAGLAVRAFNRTHRHDRDEQRARLAVRRPVEDEAADAVDEDPDEDPLVPWNEE